MKVLVTGGAGFIGSHIVDALIARGDEVTVIDDLSTGKKENINPKAKFMKIDISNPKTIETVSKERPELIFHLAAQISVPVSVKDPLLDAKINVIGLLNILEAAVRSKTKKFVYTSSGAVYGDAKTFPLRETMLANPISPYGINKWVGERYLDIFRDTKGLNSTSLRYSNVYGPRQNPHGESGVIAIFTEKMLRGEAPTINGNGSHTRDYVYVTDVVEANLLAAESKLSGPFNISTGQETSNNKIFFTLNKTLNLSLSTSYGPARPGDPLRSVLSPSLAKRKLKWVTKYDLESGVKETTEWFKQKTPH